MVLLIPTYPITLCVDEGCQSLGGVLQVGGLQLPVCVFAPFLAGFGRGFRPDSRSAACWRRTLYVSPCSHPPFAPLAARSSRTRPAWSTRARHLAG